MTNERKLDLLILNTILTDAVFCTKVRDNTLDKMHEKCRELRLEFITQYELPNFSKNPVTDNT
jgi:hypothetical protein